MSEMNPVCGPDPNRPIMMIRLRLGHEDPAIWNRLFPILKQNRECCDEVWFSTGIGITVLDEHRRMSALMAEHAEELRKIGIIPSLQFQATLGHSDRVTAEAGAAGKTWGSYVGIHGEQCRYINCPRQEGFLDYMREMAKIYAQWHPGSVWIDDDLRIHNHNPAMDRGGCCCPHCLALFAKEEGRVFSREEIESAWAAGNELKQRWEAFQLRSLAAVAETIAKATVEISPETRFGLQHCRELIRNHILPVLKKASGKRSGSRPGGGTYSDRQPHFIIDKGIAMSRQLHSQCGYETLGQVCPEIESYPRTFTCKTAQGYRLESLFYLAMGMDSLSYFNMDPLYETPEWYGRELLEPLAKEAPCYRNYLRHNEGTLPGGTGLCGPAHFFPAGAEDLGLLLAGVPFGAYSPYAACRQITENCARELPESELAEALRGDVLLDGAAVEAITKRGLSGLIGGISARLLEDSSFEFYTDDPLDQGLDCIRNFTFSARKYAFEVPEGTACRVLSRYKNVQGSDFGPGADLLERADGSRAALLGYDGFNTKYISTSRVRFLNRVADWCAHDRMPVMAVDPVQCILVPRITPDGSLRSVCIVNATIGQQKPFELRLRNVPEKMTEAEWQVPSEQPVKLTVRRNGAKAEVTIPGLAAWDIGWLKIPMPEQ